MALINELIKDKKVITAPPEIALEVGDNKFVDWKNVEVYTSMRGGAGTFGFLSSQNFEGKLAKWNIFNGDKCRVLVNGIPVITGYIEEIQVNYNEGEQSINFSGRDKTADLIDSTLNKAFEINSKSVIDIIKDLCSSFDIKVDATAAINTSR